MAVMTASSADPLVSAQQTMNAEVSKLRHINEEQAHSLSEANKQSRQATADAQRARRLLKTSNLLHEIPVLAAQLAAGQREMEVLPGTMDNVEAAHKSLKDAVAALPGQVFRKV